MIALIIYSMLLYILAGINWYLFIVLFNFKILGELVFRYSDGRIGVIKIDTFSYLIIWWICKIFNQK